MAIERTVERLEEGLRQWNLSLNAVQRDRFLRFTRLLLEWNERMSLTSITEPERIAVEHYLDSLAPLAFNLIAAETSVVDVGTGAGFPGLPLAILCPDISVTLVDATRKKVNYLNEVCAELGLTNVSVVWGRAEDLARDPAFREGFDIAVARAFGALDVVWECTVPFVKVGGLAIAYKGPKVEEELPMGEKVAPLLGAQQERCYTFELPLSSLRRALVVARKVAPTPFRFPRRAGLPEKRPLRLLVRSD